MELLWRTPEDEGKEYGWIIVEPGQTRDSKNGRPLFLIPEERIAIKTLSEDGSENPEFVSTVVGKKPEAGKVNLEIRECTDTSGKFLWWGSKQYYYSEVISETQRRRGAENKTT